jgi:hypothetical protein
VSSATAPDFAVEETGGSGTGTAVTGAAMEAGGGGGFSIGAGPEGVFSPGWADMR